MTLKERSNYINVYDMDLVDQRIGVSHVMIILKADFFFLYIYNFIHYATLSPPQDTHHLLIHRNTYFFSSYPFAEGSAIFLPHKIPLIPIKEAYV